MSSGMGIGRRVAKAKQLTQVSRAGLCNASRLQRKRAQRGEKGNGVGGRGVVGDDGGRVGRKEGLLREHRHVRGRARDTSQDAQGRGSSTRLTQVWTPESPAGAGKLRLQVSE